MLCSNAESASGYQVMGALELVLPERRLVSGRRSLVLPGRNLL